MTYVIRVQPRKGDGTKAIRRLLKYLLRNCDLKCISIDEEKFLARPHDAFFTLTMLPQEDDDRDRIS